MDPVSVFIGLKNLADGAETLVKEWWKAILGIIIGAILIFPVGQCSGAQRERERAAVKTSQADAEAVRTDAVAAIAAAGERTAGKAQTRAASEEQKRATQQTPTERLSAVSSARRCVVLRQQRTPEAKLPAECRPPARAQAGTGH